MSEPGPFDGVRAEPVGDEVVLTFLGVPPADDLAVGLGREDAETTQRVLREALDVDRPVLVHDHLVPPGDRPLTARGWVELCENPVSHVPAPLRTVRHHVWPLGWGGPDSGGNRVQCCDTCHYAVHAVLDAWRRAGRGPLGHAQTRDLLGLPDGWALGRWALGTARVGWERWEAGGRPPQRGLHELV